MKVLYLTNSAQIGGANRSLETLWEGIRCYGVKPIAVCPSDGPMPNLCRKVGVPVKIMTYQQPTIAEPFRTALAFYLWYRLLAQIKPDIVHANDFTNARSICLATSFIRKPLICHIHFYASMDYLRWVFRGLPKPNVFIHNSEATRKICGSILSQACPDALQITVHNAVPLEHFVQKDDEYTPRHLLRVGIIANLIPIKGHMDFLHMASQLTNHGIKAEYWVIGEDIYQSGYRKELERRQLDLGLGHCLKFLGHQSDIPHLLRQLDVVVSPSHKEPFGITSAEAMACGLPVVGTRVDGIPEVIEDGVTGYLVSPYAPNELADKVELLLKNFNLRKQMGSAGRKRVSRLFSREIHVKKIFNLYQSVLSS